MCKGDITRHDCSGVARTSATRSRPTGFFSPLRPNIKKRVAHSKEENKHVAHHMEEEKKWVARGDRSLRAALVTALYG